MDTLEQDEVWMTIQEAPRFSVSSFGRVRRDKSLKKHLGSAILKPRADRAGYLAVSMLLGSGLEVSRKVHRLVLEAFVGKRPDGMECRHMDGNPANNRLENIQWGTPKQNLEDQIKHGKLFCGEALSFSKLTERDVRQIRTLHEVERLSYPELGRRFNALVQPLLGR